MSSKKNFVGSLLILLFVSLLTARSLFSSQLPRTDDLELHAARIVNYYLAIKQGQLPPYWAPNLNGGLGYPAFTFMYPFPTMIGTAFYTLGLPVEASINLVIILSLVIGSLGMWLFSWLKWQKSWSSLLVASSYILAPSTLVAVFVRGALGEIVFFAVLPWILVLWQPYKFSHQGWYRLITVLLATTLFLNHQLSVLLAIPILAGYVCWTVWQKQSKLKHLLWLGISFLIGLLLSSFFLIPMLFEKANIVLTPLNTTERFLPWYQIFVADLTTKGFWFGQDATQLPLAIGLPFLLVAGFLAWQLWRERSKLKLNNLPEHVYWLLIFGIAVILLLPISTPIWKFSYVLLYLQFPWRLLWVTSFTGSLLVGYLLNSKEVTLQIKQVFMLILIIILSSYFGRFSKPVSYIFNADELWRQYGGSSTTLNELDTIWFNRNKSRNLAKQLTLINQSNQVVENYQAQITTWTGSLMSYQITNDQPVTVVQRTMYYPGWEVWVNNQEKEIDYQHQEYPGLISYQLPAGEHKIVAKFTTDVWTKKLGSGLTLFAVALLIIWIRLRHQFIAIVKT